MLVIPLIAIFFILILYLSIDMIRMMQKDVRQMGNYLAFRALRIMPFKYSRLPAQPLSHYQHLWFVNHFPYYDYMSLVEKEKFHSRVASLLGHKKIVAGKLDFPLTPNKEQFIISVLVYMTLGLDRFDLPAFDRVIVFPKEYFNKHTKRYHKGEANLRGSVIFSWKDFKESFISLDDNLNLALHEFAHALSIQAQYYPQHSDVAFSYYLDQWKEVTSQEYVMNSVKQAGYFRQYAYTNEEEFFAVATECYFESPTTFQRELPYLYSIIAKIYNQDLAAKLAKTNAA